jgi:predicted Zn-dependent protease
VKTNRFFFLIGVLLLLAGCATTGPGGKKSLILISTADEVEIGRQMAQEVESKEDVLDDAMVQSFVSQVGKKVAQVSDRKDLAWHFKVIRNKEVNAFALPGGYVYVYTGLLKGMDSEAELAGALGHEIGHVVARHSVKKLQTMYGLDILLQIAGVEQKSKAAQVAIQMGSVLVLQGYSRADEFEADYDGTFYEYKAGYNPTGMKNLLTTLKSLETREPGALEKLLATHPPTSDRVAQVDSAIAKLPANARRLPMGQESFQPIWNRLP